MPRLSYALIPLLALSFGAAGEPKGSSITQHACRTEHLAGIFTKRDGSVYAGKMPIVGGAFVVTISPAGFALPASVSKKLGPGLSAKLRSDLEGIPCDAAKKSAKDDVDNPFSAILKMGCHRFRASFSPTIGTYSLLVGGTRNRFESVIPLNVFHIRDSGKFSYVLEDGDDLIIARGTCSPF